MLSNPTERGTQRRAKVTKAISEFRNTDLFKLYAEYYRLLLDQKVSILINATGEEAVALRGEIRCLKHLLSLADSNDTPFTDSIT